MCGIAGWYRRGRGGVAESIVRGQCDTIVHRGPDDAGVFVDGDFGFGMRRLSIIDLAGGHQPMFTADGRYAIVLNGEIYNHLELRPELEARGHRFRTTSDTETLLEAYACWRDDVWLRLEGMYGVAIWDRRERELTLARDPLGIKPLFVTEQLGAIAFASEIKALAVLPEHRFDLDERAVHDFFRFGHALRPRSFFQQVRSLDPAHVLRIGASGEAKLARFWRPRLALRGGLSEAEWIEETRTRLLATVRSHMLADVPVGSLLSGGVDSGAVTAAMARAGGKRIKCFTISHPQSKIDEADAARRVADHLGFEHCVQPIDLLKASDVIPAIQRCFDEPSGASAAIPTWYVSKLAARHVKVVLSGEGGDELFAGYKRQRKGERMRRRRALHRALGPLAGALELVPASAPAALRRLQRKGRAWRESATIESGFQRSFAGTQILPAGLRTQLYTRDFAERFEGEASLAALEKLYFPDADAREASELEQFMLADLTVHMPSTLLGRLDRTSMAHSLEARVPLLSHKFVDWSLTVPLDMKARGPGKYALREAVRPWLPEGALERPKQGFQMPLKEWFAGDFIEFAREAWHGSGASRAGYLRGDALDRLADEHRSGVADHGRVLYAITIFSCWWADQKAPRAVK
jgi:asparagine synthase (glutamine-hydrolysing)